MSEPIAASVEVSTEAQLAAAINAANAASAADPGAALAPIVLEANIALTSALPIVDLANGSSLTIESAGGDHFSLDGGGDLRALAVDGGDVTLSAIALTNAEAAGLSGSGNGGGGAGLGGGLFVGSGATVNLDDVNFSNDKAVGGTGGVGIMGSFGQMDSQGGLGGKGGGGGAGGGFTAAPGTIGRGGDGGPGGTTDKNPKLTGQAGGFGGGGGGGGGGVGSAGSTDGGRMLPAGAGGPGGKGGFGAGAGDAGYQGGYAPDGSNGGQGGSGGNGGGGLGAGGDIFVQSGGTLLIEGGTLSGGAASGGAGGFGLNPAGSGAGYGSGIFVQGTSAVVFDPAAGQSVVVDDAIADMTGSKDASGLTGALTLDMNGAGALVLNNAGDTFTGGVDLNAGTLTLGAATAAGTGAITFGASATLALDAAAQQNGKTFADTLADFGGHDRIDLAGLKYAGAAPTTVLSVSGGALTVDENGESETFSLATPGQQTFFASSDGAGGTLISAACYVAGTLILTDGGEKPIEALDIGDLVVTASGALRPVRWIGRRKIDISRHPDPLAVRPVRVGAGAFGEGLPRRDLQLSPGHNIAWEGALMPISCLINGRSVAQIEVDHVEYRHVELDAHDVILAEGLPAESYLDCGNRTAFANGGAFVEAHPDFRPKHWADTCLPLVWEGPAVAATKARLLARLAERGCEVTQEADAHVRVDGRRVRPIRLGETRLAFVLPAGGRNIALRSRTFAPAHTVAESADPRTLGLCVAALQIDGSPVALEADDLCATGWREAEFEGGRFKHRWTTGATPLPAGARLVIVEIGEVGYYWRERRDDGAQLFA